MKSNFTDTSIGDILDMIPIEFKDPDVRRALHKLTKDLDELTSINDSSQTVAVDRAVALRIIRDNFPADMQERVQREMEGHLGQTLKDLGRDRHLPWLEMTAHDNPFHPVSPAELQELGIDAKSSSTDVRRVLREHYPGIPEFFLDADPARIHDTTIQALLHNRTVWDCCVAHLGWWGAVAVFAAAGAFLIVGTATGPWGIPLAVWLIGMFGGGTAVILLNCVWNPQWVGP